MFQLELPEKFRRYVPLVVWALVAVVVFVIPLKITGLGYLPFDDALRHVAKAVSGKSWPEILVLGDGFKLDHNLGWHAFLGAVHRATNWGTEDLIVFSSVLLFVLVNGAMLPWLRRPEAWLAALLTAMLISDLPQRFMLGRPFILTITVLMTILFAAQKCRPDWRMFALFTIALTLCTFVHGVWYLWVLPIAAFFFAGQFRWTILLALSWIVAVAFSSLLTGHPVDYLAQAVSMATNSVGQHETNRTEVTELQPFGGDIFAVVTVGVLVALKLFTKSPVSLTRNPAFWIVAGCWILAFRVCRFWEDWGWPSLMVLIATEVEFLFVARFQADSLRRLLLALILALATFLAVTCDFNSRWTQSLTWQFLSVADHPELAGWMPDKGGILYSSDMNVFYQTFYKNPHADWRYMVGYEPALMPADDFKTFYKILWNDGDVKAYAPWVAKMTPADRLVIHGTSGAKPNIPQLEWNYGISGTWIGRTPRTSAK